MIEERSFKKVKLAWDPLPIVDDENDVFYTVREINADKSITVLASALRNKSTFTINRKFSVG